MPCDGRVCKNVPESRHSSCMSITNVSSRSPVYIGLLALVCVPYSPRQGSSFLTYRVVTVTSGRVASTLATMCYATCCGGRISCIIIISRVSGQHFFPSATRTTSSFTDATGHLAPVFRLCLPTCRKKDLASARDVFVGPTTFIGLIRVSSS